MLPPLRIASVHVSGIGLDLKVQVLNAEEYFAWLGTRLHTYRTLQEYSGGRHASGDEAKALLGID